MRKSFMLFNLWIAGAAALIGKDVQIENVAAFSSDVKTSVVIYYSGAEKLRFFALDAADGVFALDLPGVFSKFDFSSLSFPQADQVRQAPLDPDADKGISVRFFLKENVTCDVFEGAVGELTLFFEARPTPVEAVAATPAVREPAAVGDAPDVEAPREDSRLASDLNDDDMSFWELSGGSGENRLSGVTVAASASGGHIFLRAPDVQEFKRFSLIGPDRFVVDLQETVLSLSRNDLELAHPLVKMIRVRQFQTKPTPVTRMVLDLAAEINVNVFRHEGGVAVVFADGPQRLDAMMAQLESGNRVAVATADPAVEDDAGLNAPAEMDVDETLAEFDSDRDALAEPAASDETAPVDAELDGSEPVAETVEDSVQAEPVLDQSDPAVDQTMDANAAEPIVETNDSPPLEAADQPAETVAEPTGSDNLQTPTSPASEQADADADPINSADAVPERAMAKAAVEPPPLPEEADILEEPTEAAVIPEQSLETTDEAAMEPAEPADVADESLEQTDKAAMEPADTTNVSDESLEAVGEAAMEPVEPTDVADESLETADEATIEPAEAVVDPPTALDQAAAGNGALSVGGERPVAADASAPDAMAAVEPAMADESAPASQPSPKADPAELAPPEMTAQPVEAEPEPVALEPLTAETPSVAEASNLGEPGAIESKWTVAAEQPADISEIRALLGNPKQSETDDLERAPTPKFEAASDIDREMQEFLDNGQDKTFYGMMQGMRSNRKVSDQIIVTNDRIEQSKMSLGESRSMQEQDLDEPDFAELFRDEAASDDPYETIAGGEQQYRGFELSIIDVKDANVVDLLRFIADQVGINLFVDQSVGEIKATYRFRNIPWDQALDIILANANLDKQFRNGVLRVATTQKFREEEEAKALLREQRELSVPVETVTVPLNYADAAEVLPIVEEYLSPRGTILMDERTNLLIIEDIPKKIVAIRALLKRLDKMIAQVTIEARIVETTKRFLKELGIQWGLSANYSPELGTDTGVDFPNRLGLGGPTIGSQSPGGLQGGYAVNFPVVAENPSGIGLTLGNFLDNFKLDISLQMLESEGYGQIVSSPKITTQNNKTALIKNGQRIPIQTIQRGTVTTRFIDAVLELQVTPHITSDETIIMDLVVDKSEPDFTREVEGNPVINIRRAETKVLVKNGGTAVIGGIFTLNESNTEVGIPGLRKVPILKRLFSRELQQYENQELLIFVTPRIVKY